MRLKYKRDELCKALDKMPIYESCTEIKEIHADYIKGIDFADVAKTINALIGISQSHKVTTAEILNDPAFVTSILMYEKALRQVDNSSKSVALIILKLIEESGLDTDKVVVSASEDSIEVKL